MSKVQNIIEKFGGLTAMSKALGHKHVTTVQGWKVNDKIPHWRRAEIEAAAIRMDIDLSSEFAPAE